KAQGGADPEVLAILEFAPRGEGAQAKDQRPRTGHRQDASNTANDAGHRTRVGGTRETARERRQEPRRGQSKDDGGAIRRKARARSPIRSFAGDETADPAAEADQA